MNKIIYGFVTIFVMIGFYFSMQQSIEAQARKQNVFNLEAVVACTSTVMDKNITVGTFISALNACAKNQRSLGITGDIFVIRKSDKKLFWDASVDCKPDDVSKLFMTAEGVCSLFRKPETCIKAVDEMVNHSYSNEINWDFDNSNEWVNYAYFPKKIEGDEFIIGQGTQQDEANTDFNLPFIIILGFGLATIIFNSI